MRPLTKMRRPFSTPIVSSLLHSQVEISHLPSLTILHQMCDRVCKSIGNLDDLESSLAQFKLHLTPPLSSQLLDRCRTQASGRRLLRFILWSKNVLGQSFPDGEFNRALRVVAEKKDVVATQILLREMHNEGRSMEPQTFSAIAYSLVSAGRYREALGIFKNLEKFKLPIDGGCVVIITCALCSKGHAREAQRVLMHHKDKLSPPQMETVFKFLIHGWSKKRNPKEARNVLKEMRRESMKPDIICYNTYLKGLCDRMSERNPSGLVSDAMNVIAEMRCNGIEADAASYNTVLLWLGRLGRMKESGTVFEMMKKRGCEPNWVSYYHVARGMLINGRFGKAAKLMDEMREEGVVADKRFYFGLIRVLLKMDRVRIALEVVERMTIAEVGACQKAYEMVIPKLYQQRDYEKGTELWNQAVSMGAYGTFSCDLLEFLVAKSE